MSVDALGNPLRFTLTGGQAHDITQAYELIDGIESEYVIADRGYDSQWFRERIVEMGATPVIPPRSSRREPQPYDEHLYGEELISEVVEIEKSQVTERAYPPGITNRR